PTEEPTEYSLYDYEETVTEPSQLDEAERFIEERKEDQTKPLKTKGDKSRSYWPV
ncbi:hypothetical protein M9458_027470, partial [Cirrhinus mrigala]